MMDALIMLESSWQRNDTTVELDIVSPPRPNFKWRGANGIKREGSSLQTFMSFLSEKLEKGRCRIYYPYILLIFVVLFYAGNILVGKAINSRNRHRTRIQ